MADSDEKRSILVIGATGRVGKEVVKHLLLATASSSSIQLICTSRNPSGNAYDDSFIIHRHHHHPPGSCHYRADR